MKNRTSAPLENESPKYCATVPKTILTTVPRSAVPRYATTSPPLCVFPTEIINPQYKIGQQTCKDHQRKTLKHALGHVVIWIEIKTHEIGDVQTRRNNHYIHHHLYEWKSVRNRCGKLLPAFLLNGRNLYSDTCQIKGRDQHSEENDT